jgi:hypothetical protein
VFSTVDFFSPASSIVIYELKNGLMCSFQRCPRALLFPALFWRAQPMGVIELGAIVGTKRSYADVVRGTAGKNSSATDAVRQPAVNGKR